MSDRALASLIALAGAALYLALALGLFLDSDLGLVGTEVYNYYFLALTEGRFDIPPLIITTEGHYDAEGRAFIYHGIAPLLTRALAWPFVDLTAAPWLAGLSIWLFAAGGTLAYHLAAMQLVAVYAVQDATVRRRWTLLLSISVWFCAPGLMLAANHSMFHEPTSVAYFCAAWSVFLYVQVMFFEEPPGAVLLPLAVLAGLAVLARPHVAVGLYLGVGLLALAHLRMSGFRPALPRLWSAGLVLLAFGLAFLAVNALRFGDPLTMFGTNEASSLEYGFTYWQIETPDTERMAAFLEHGTFNIGRVAPNLFLYAIDLPWGALTGDARDIEAGPLNALYRDWTVHLGFIRVEAPRVGFFWMWSPWLVLAVLGLFAPALGAPRGWPAFAAVTVIAIFMLSYGTVTLRYRVELFPLVALAGLCGAARMMAADWRGLAAFGLPGLAAAASMVISLGVAMLYGDNFNELDGISRWDVPTCLQLAAEKGFAPADAERICAL